MLLNDFLRKMLLSDDNVKSYIIAKYINFFNKTFNEYLSHFNVNFGIIFDNVLNTKFIGGGYDELDYDNLSAGEEKAVDFAIMFTFDKLNDIMDNTDYNILIWDEILGGLDKKLTTIAFNILKQKSLKKSVFVIEHNFDEDYQVDQIWEVTKDRIKGSQLKII